MSSDNANGTPEAPPAVPIPPFSEPTPEPPESPVKGGVQNMRIL